MSSIAAVAGHHRPPRGGPGAAAGSLRPIVVLPIPASSPPPVGVIEPTAPQPGPSRGFVQEALAVDFSPGRDIFFDRQATARSDLPDPQMWAAHLAQAVVEVMTGSRPAPQLLRWTTSEVYAVLARRGALSARRGVPRGRRATVRTVRVCEPRDGIAEACAVVVDGSRVRALAMRMAGLDGRWRIEALQVG
jgi:hypothetical protein